MWSIQKQCLIVIKIYHFYQKEKFFGKVEELNCGIEDKEKYFVHVRALKQVINHVLKPKEVHRVIQFNQKAWLKPYIDKNTDVRKEGKNKFGKDFFKLMNNFAFGKTMENIRNHRDIKLVTLVVSERNYHTHKRFDGYRNE